MGITDNVPALGKVANFGTDYFLLKIKFLAKCKREFTTKFAILPNACYEPYLFFFLFNIIQQIQNMLLSVTSENEIKEPKSVFQTVVFYSPFNL